MKTNIAELNVKLSAMSETIARMNPEIASLNGAVDDQSQSVNAIHEMTTRLQGLAQQLGKVTSQTYG